MISPSLFSNATNKKYPLFPLSGFFNKLACAFPNDQNRTGGLSNHFFGGAAEEYLLHSAVAVRGNDNQVYLLIFGILNDFIKRFACS